MAWAAFSYMGNMVLHIVPPTNDQIRTFVPRNRVVQGRQNADGYIGMLEQLSHFTEGARLCGED